MLERHKVQESSGKAKGKELELNITENEQMVEFFLFVIGFLNTLLGGWGIRKVKDALPSPFYDGKYHPPLLGSIELRLFINSKIEKILRLCQ